MESACRTAPRRRPPSISRRPRFSPLSLATGASPTRLAIRRRSSVPSKGLPGKHGGDRHRPDPRCGAEQRRRGRQLRVGGERLGHEAPSSVPSALQVLVPAAQ